MTQSNALKFLEALRKNDIAECEKLLLAEFEYIRSESEKKRSKKKQSKKKRPKTNAEKLLALAALKASLEESPKHVK